MKRRASAALALFLCCCATPRATQPPQRRLSAAGRASRVILVSFDGAAADAVKASSAPNFFALPLRAERTIPIEPTATAPTHAALLTGAKANVTGVVSNLFHIPGRPPGTFVRGLDAENEAETLLDAARRAGKSTGIVAFPSLDGSTPRRRGDWGIAWTSTAAGRILHLRRSDFRAEWVPPGWTGTPRRRPSYSPVMRARLEWSAPDAGRRDVDITAYDTTDDHTTNYDLIVPEIDESELPVENGWFAIASQRDEALFGSWSKILHADPALRDVTIYWGNIARARAYPAAFQKMADATAGFWPGQPDETSAREWLAGRDGIDPLTYSEQARRLSGYLTRITTLGIERMPFDLLLAYQPLVDQTEHQFLIVTPRQTIAAEKRAAVEQARRIAYETFDRIVGTLTAAVDLNRDALVVAGDHGMMPVDTEVHLNSLLVMKGQASVKGEFLGDESRWGAYATGNVAHLYRFQERDNTGEIMHLLETLRFEGEPVFERIEKKTPASHRNSGDIVAFAWPRFALSSTLGELFTRPAYYGQHGGLNHHPELHTIFGAAGAGVKRETLPEVRQTEIARYVADLLGIDPPRSAE